MSLRQSNDALDVAHPDCAHESAARLRVVAFATTHCADGGRSPRGVSHKGATSAMPAASARARAPISSQRLASLLCGTAMIFTCALSTACASRVSGPLTVASPSSQATPRPHVGVTSTEAAWRSLPPTSTPVNGSSTSTPTVPRVIDYPENPGRYVVYAAEQGRLDGRGGAVTGLEYVSEEGGSQGLLAEGPGEEAALAPNQRWLAFVGPLYDSVWTSQGRLMLLDLSTGELSRSDIQMLPSRLSWSPDGGKLIASVDGEIEVIDVPTMTRKRLTSCRSLDYGDGYCSHPVWSPQGDLIAYSLALGGSTGDPRSGLYLLDSSCALAAEDCASKSHFTQLSPGVYAWSPDGKLLAYGGPPLRIYDVLRMETTRTIPYEGTVTDIAWSPDGSHLAVSDGAGTQLVNIETGQVHRLVKDLATIAVVFGMQVPNTPE